MSRGVGTATGGVLRALGAACIALALGAGAAPAQVEQAREGPGSWTVVEDESLLAVVTRRAGPAARLAHDHLIHATRYGWDFEFDPESPLEASFRVGVQVAGLRVDDPEARASARDRLIELGILDEPFQEIGDDDREKVRSEMVDPDQLDEQAHPIIEFETGAIRERSDPAFPYEIELRVRIRDHESVVPVSARMQVDSDRRVRIEAWGETRFTDFAIEPYSAFLGAVKNRDEFYLYLDLVLEPEP